MAEAPEPVEVSLRYHHGLLTDREARQCFQALWYASVTGGLQIAEDDVEHGAGMDTELGHRRLRVLRVPPTVELPFPVRAVAERRPQPPVGFPFREQKLPRDCPDVTRPEENPQSLRHGLARRPTTAFVGTHRQSGFARRIGGFATKFRVCPIYIMCVSFSSCSSFSLVSGTGI